MNSEEKARLKAEEEAFSDGRKYRNPDAFSNGRKYREHVAWFIHWLSDDLSGWSFAHIKFPPPP